MTSEGVGGPAPEASAVILERRLAALPRFFAPADFNDRLLLRLQAETAHRPYRFTGALAWPPLPATRRDCAFYFLLAGLFYAITGMVFLAILRKVEATAAVAGWIALQPLLSFIMAFGFMTASFLVVRGSQRARRVIADLVWVYSLFLMINGLFLQRAFAVPYTAVMIFCMTGVGVLMGVFLAVTLQRGPDWAKAE